MCSHQAQITALRSSLKEEEENKEDMRLTEEENLNADPKKKKEAGGWQAPLDLTA